MLKNHIKTAFRNLWKNRLFSALNLVGLIFGLASIMTLMFGVYAYYSADSDLKNKEDLYYLKVIDINGEGDMSTTYPFLGEVVNASPEIAAATHIQRWNAPWLEHEGKSAQDLTQFVDTTYFKVFTLPFKYGHPEHALKDKYSIVLSSAISDRLFGDQNPVGKTVKADDSINLTVTGVLEPLSAYASVEPKILLTSALLKDTQGFIQGANWYNTFATNYVRLKPNANIPLFEKRMRHIAALNYANDKGIDKFIAAPFSELRKENNPTVNTIITGSIATSVFILLIVLINLLNLNISLMYGRTKEVAIRKIMGSGKKSLIIQFCIENGLLVFTSLLLAGLLFLGFLQPQMNKIYGSQFGSISFNLKDDYPLIPMYLGLGLLITLIVGILPTLRYISLPVSTAIKGKINTFKNNFFVRNAFITLQFSLAIIFICTAIILTNQIKYMQQAPLGFNSKNLSYVQLDLEYKNADAAQSYFKTVLDRLKSNPYVKSVSTSQVIPSKYQYNYNDFYDPNTQVELNIRKGITDADYLKTYEIPIIAGRDFDADQSATEENNIIINQTAMRALGWKDINNKQLVEKGGEEETYNVLGVMKDFHYQDMQQNIEPILHYYGKQRLGTNYLSLRIEKGHEKAVLSTLKNDFATIDTRREFQANRLTSEISGQYALIEGILKTVNFVAFLTILISSLGMFGLISLIAKKRVKEIGIRKTLGAGATQITVLLSKDFIMLVILAAIIAFPLTWLLMHTWLQDFAYRIDLKWWMFALGGFMGLLITVLTVGIQSVKAAIENPVNSLRAE
ncbi:MAG TPA: ABC transporter permease [Leeuwenhoekiella sp.]|nr:ABC transporter permease [Leeuwenhoekiella sp.]